MAVVLASLGLLLALALAAFGMFAVAQSVRPCRHRPFDDLSPHLVHRVALGAASALLMLLVLLGVAIAVLALRAWP